LTPALCRGFFWRWISSLKPSFFVEQRDRVEQELELRARHDDDIPTPQGERFFSDGCAVKTGAALSFNVAQEIAVGTATCEAESSRLRMRPLGNRTFTVRDAGAADSAGAALPTCIGSAAMIIVRSNSLS
jgi:threonine dehydratase